ncbi:MAG TPA: sulfatase-like hydrolase/transferase, partial [Armatimonadota bacterium]|nr:sulfatase-like hydrolase/transferase [Armatimonadota bacterium]
MQQARKIVIIMTDTQRFDMLGCYGNSDMATPCLDRLAEQGIRFQQAYTCQPVCGPARSAIFTGTFPHSNGSWGNSMPLGDNVKTIGQRLHNQNFHTAYIGKWHLDGGDYFGNGRCPDGWDPAYWYDMRCYLDELTPEERLLSRKTATNQHPTITEDFTFGHRVSNRAIDFLTKHQDDFLLVVS